MMTITEISRSRPGVRHVVLTVLCGLLLLCHAAGSAHAAGGPVLDVTQQAQPSRFAPGETARYGVIVTNISAVASLDPVTITDTLPAGVTYASMMDFYGVWACSAAVGDSVVQCTLSQELKPGAEAPALMLNVQVAAGASGAGENVIVLSGPGGITDTSRTSTVFSAETAPFGITGFEAWGVDSLGTAAHRAGSHPDLTTTISIATNRSRQGGTVLPDNMKQIAVDLPPGLIGNPTAVPTCSAADLANSTGVLCAPETQVGTLAFTNAQDSPFVYRNGSNAGFPVYNIEPPIGAPARFGFNLAGVVTMIVPRVRTGGDYGVTAEINDLTQTLSTVDSTLTLWGVPADPSHDAMRSLPDGTRGVSSHTPPRPFFTTPTSCTGSPLVTKLSLSSWLNPSQRVSASTSTDLNGQPAMNDGCEDLEFDPTVAVVPSTTQPDAPSGLKVTIDSPQNLDNPVGLGSAHLRNVKVTLPDGMTINPGSADGLGACTDQQLGLSNDQDAGCPESAKIGTVTASTPLLKETLSGGVYIRTQASGDPESGDMFRMALVLQNKERGILVKLGGAIKVNKDTGRIVTEFDNNPQLPVEHIELSLKSGPRAPLANPVSCGSKSVETQLASWAGHTVNATNAFTIACTDGLGGFAPTLRAGAGNPVGGAFSPFAVSIGKPDGNSAINGLNMVLPAGLVANLKGNINTQVGTVTTLAGPGAAPFALPGKVFLEGQYGDAPFSLRVVVPAKAGPFDLGEVVVRQKIYVNPENAQVTIVSDPIPTVVKGVPVRLQRLDVDVDKPGFMINPTSCDAKEIKGTLASVAGQTATLTNRFQVGSCASLGFAPKLAMTMTGKGQTKDGSHPALKSHLVTNAGDANSKRVSVTLPLSLALDPGNANGLCEPVDAAKNACPAKSIVGSAQAASILPDTLKGPVYFVRGERLDSRGIVRKTLPKLFIPLSANGVTVNVHASSNVEGERLVTTFENLPDAPFSTFDLNIDGGKHGILAVSNTNVCAATQVADAQFAGQNSKVSTPKITMGTPCPLGIVKSSHTSTALKLTVGGLGAGKLTGSGNGVAKATKTLKSATTATLSLKLSKASRRALARHRDVKVKVTVGFTPKGAKKAKKAVKTITIHGA